MTRTELAALRSEHAQLKAMLDSMSGASRFGLGSLKVRMERLERLIREAGTPKRDPYKVRLTFRGLPVVRSEGIYADFGLEAVNTYSDAVAKLAVSSTAAPLKERGPIPDKQANKLLITNTAIGSFGFELQEPESRADMVQESATAQAMEQVSVILHSTQGTDDELAESITDADPRALASIRSFLQLMEKNEAVFTLAHDDQVVHFTDVGAIRASLARINEANVHESTEVMEGEFRGMIPSRRDFEFWRGDEKVVGKIAKGLEGAEAINKNLYKKVKITMSVTRVGEGRPKYVLSEMPKWD